MAAILANQNSYYTARAESLPFLANEICTYQGLENLCRLFLLFLFSNREFLLSLCYSPSNTEHFLYFNQLYLSFNHKFAGPQPNYSSRTDRITQRSLT